MQFFPSKYNYHEKYLPIIIDLSSEMKYIYQQYPRICGACVWDNI